MRTALGRAATAAFALAALVAIHAIRDGAAPQVRLPAAADDVPDATARVVESFGRLPLGFEPCGDGFDGDAEFVAYGRDCSLELSPREAVIRPYRSDDRVALRVAGARADAEIAGERRLPGVVSYFDGPDPDEWRTGIPTYASVRCSDVRPGVDVVYHGTQGALELDFVVKPGAPVESVAVEVDGASDVALGDAGDVLLHTSAGAIRLSPPVAYQDVGGERRTVDAHFALDDAGRIAFEVGAYDPAAPLVIDPELAYSTILAPQPWEYCHGVAADAGGYAYACGTGDRGLFVVKLSPDGQSMVYTAIISSEGDAYGIVVTDDGSAIIGGHTSTPSFPTTAGAYQRQIAGDFDSFVTKLRPNGTSLEYSTLVGGSADDRAYDLGVDADGSPYIAGRTSSSDFPTTAGAFQPARAGDYDGFVTKLNPSGSALVYSTYIGGSGSDRCHGVRVDSAGRASCAGWTESGDFPVRVARQPSRAGGRDAFVAKLDATGGALVFSTYLGGEDSDSVERLTVDDLGATYVSGITSSIAFPTWSAARWDYRGERDAFVTKFAADGRLVYSTYLGGSLEEYGGGIAVDALHRAYVVGWTASTNFPIAPAASVAPQGAEDVVVTLLDTDGSRLLASMRFGGYHHDTAGSIALGAPGVVYVSGHTDSPDFPSIIQPAQDYPYRHAYVAKVTGFVPTSTAPEFVEGPSADPPLAIVGANVLFRVRPNDPDNDPMTVTWDFGDGGTAVGEDVGHAFDTTGAHVVTVSVSDGLYTVQSDVTVQVVEEIVDAQLKVKLNLDFKREDRDSLKVKGTLDLPAEFDPEHETLVVDVGGASHAFVMDRKGRARPVNGSASLRYKKRKGVWKLAVNIRKRNIADAVSDEGLVDQQLDDLHVALRCLVVAGTYATDETVGLVYKARAGKWGKAK